MSESEAVQYGIKEEGDAKDSEYFFDSWYFWNKCIDALLRDKKSMLDMIMIILFMINLFDSSFPCKKIKLW